MGDSVKRQNVIFEDMKYESGDRRLSEAIAMSFLGLLLLNTLVNLTPALAANARNISIATKVLIAFFFLRGLPVLLSRNSAMTAIAVFVFALTVFFQYNFFENKTSLIRYAIEFSYLCLPLVLFVISIKNLNILYDILVDWSRPVIYIVPCILVYVFFYNHGWFGYGSYRMGFSYAVLTPTLIMIDKTLRTKRKLDWLGILGSISAIALLGARGSLFCIIAYAGIYILFYIKSEKKRLGLLFLIIIVSIFFLVFYVGILRALVDFLYSMGFRSRSLLVLSRGGIFLTGREVLYDIVWQQILKFPLFGTGITGDVSLLRGYVHNILLELMINFGIIQGFVIFSTLLFFLYQGIKQEFRRNENGLFLIFASLAIPYLLVSGTFWLSDKFWILIGLLVPVVSQSMDWFRIQIRNKSIHVIG